jgi:hypothetical protein
MSASWSAGVFKRPRVGGRWRALRPPGWSREAERHVMPAAVRIGAVGIGSIGTISSL